MDVKGLKGLIELQQEKMLTLHGPKLLLVLDGASDEIIHMLRNTCRHHFQQVTAEVFYSNSTYNIQVVVWSFQIIKTQQFYSDQNEPRRENVCWLKFTLMRNNAKIIRVFFLI